MPFYMLFTDVAAKETRVVQLLQPQKGLPVGRYAFIELYCEDKGCDCRKTMIQIVPDGSITPVLATLHYGWEKIEFYMKWASMPRSFAKKMARDITGVCLDPGSKITIQAQALLSLFRTVIASDPDYAKRFARHYDMFKAVINSK